MTTVHVSSDWHLGHRFVAQLRGFATTDDHDQAIVDNALKVLEKDDRLILCGDMTASSGKLDRVLEIVRALPCPVDLVAGNHDACHSMHRDAHKWQRRYLEAFASVQVFMRRRIENQEVLFSHFPYHNDRGEARYTQYRLRDEGRWLVHGHTHGPERFHDRREIHVGLDAWNMRPVGLGTIAQIIRENPQEGQ